MIVRLRLLAAGLLLLSVAGRTQAPSPRTWYNAPARQTLTYEVDWRVFPGGTAVLHVEQDGDLERVSVTGDSVGAVNLIFRVSDRFQSTFSRSAGCSASFSKQLIEGRRQVDSEQKFVYPQHKAFYDEKNLIAHSHTTKQRAIPSCVTDPLSGMFYVASQPLVVGKSFHIPVADATHLTDVTIQTEARETIRTPTATYQTVRVQPTADAGVVKNRGNIWIWYTDDQRHLPVQMRARFLWGTITFRLLTVESK